MRLSIIIPVYNVENYLCKCVESLMHQDYNDYEIILVDDGSTDGSDVLADTLSRSSLGRINVIHQENQGLSGARNTGIAAAQGDYVVFVDSDDYWDSNVLGDLMAQVERDNLDVLRFKYRNVNEHYEVCYPNKTNPFQFDDYSESVVDGFSFLNNRLGMACYAVMYIVRRELLKGCLFTLGIYFEDTDWTPRMLLKADRVASTERIVYNYLVREGSITHAVSRGKQLKVLNDKLHLVGELQRQVCWLKKKGLQSPWFDGMISTTVISIISLLSTDFYPDRKKYLGLLSAMEVFPLSGKYCNALALRKLRLINLSPRLTIEILHIKNK